MDYLFQIYVSYFICCNQMVPVSFLCTGTVNGTTAETETQRLKIQLLQSVQAGLLQHMVQLSIHGHVWPVILPAICYSLGMLCSIFFVCFKFC